MATLALPLGAGLCALAVVAGAFGAHGLKVRLDPRGLELWETAARYLMYSGLGLALIGLTARLTTRVTVGTLGWAATATLAGAVIFSGTVALLALGGPRWLGAVTPIGGALLVAGFALFGWAALRL